MTVMGYNQLSIIRIHKFIQVCTHIPKGQLFLTVECQLINAEEMMVLGNHHFATILVKEPGKNHQGMLKHMLKVY